METWRKLINSEMQTHGETFDDVESTTLSPEDLHRDFNAGFGGCEGVPFTLWTHKRVYFPVVYVGAEWVGSASRNPDGKPTRHMGGQ